MDEVDEIVAQWERQAPDLETLPMEVFGRIYRLSALVGEAMARVYERYGLTRGEFDVLATLRRAGEPHRLAPRDLAASLMVTTGGMTGRLEKLTVAGLIRRVPHPTDGRCVYAELTEEGASRLDEALRAGVQAQAAVTRHLGAQRLRTVADDLRELLAVSQQALRHL
jgi:DNA-binding MarR family transcriptional regulator